MEPTEVKEVTLDDGRVITKRNPKVREMANAENQPKNKDYLVKYAVMAAKLSINGKPAVMEDILDTMTEEDLIKIAPLFGIDEDAEKNS